MSKVRLRDVRQGQVFYEKDGIYITKLRALSDAQPTICNTWLCRCKVLDGLCPKGEIIVLKDGPDAIVPLNLETEGVASQPQPKGPPTTRDTASRFREYILAKKFGS